VGIPVLSRAKDKEEEVVTPNPKAAKYRNISPMLLTLDDGRHFPRNSIAELTPAEVERFEGAVRNTGRAHIAPVGGK